MLGKSLSCSQHWTGDLCHSFVFQRALHFKTELEKHGLVQGQTVLLKIDKPKVICRVCLAALSNKSPWSQCLFYMQNTVQRLEAFSVEQIKKEGYSLLLFPIRKLKWERGHLLTLVAMGKSEFRKADSSLQEDSVAGPLLPAWP